MIDTGGIVIRTLRAAMLPVVFIAAIIFLASIELGLDQIAHFGFIWDVLLGGALGALLAFMPTIVGFSGKRNVTASMMWVGAFMVMLVVFYQYISLVTNISTDFLAFMRAPGARMRVVEGVLIGYLSFGAGRGRV